MTKFEQQNVWKIVNETRRMFVSTKTKIECQESDTFLSDIFMKDIIDILEERLIGNKTILDEPQNNISLNTLEFSAKIYIYLNFCPPKLNYFLKDATLHSSPKYILVALTRIMKMSQNAAKKSSRKILTKAMKIFKLENYKSIDTITRQQGFKGCAMNSNSSCKDLGLNHILSTTYSIINFRSKRNP